MASGKGNTFIGDLLKYVFQATRPSWDEAANVYISLHTASPGAGGNQSTNECTYTGYARVAVPTNSTNWTLTAETIENALAISFPTNSGASQSVLAIGVGSASSGAGELFYFGTISSTAIAAGNTPVILALGLQITES
jgi:hypothetical protein